MKIENVIGSKKQEIECDFKDVLEILMINLVLYLRKSHKIQFYKRIEDVNNTISYVFTKSHRHRMQLYIEQCI